MSLIDDAIIFAAQAHGAIQHRRKWSGIPYIAHPIEVMTIVATVPDHTEPMLAAAVLHDVVEDTPVSIAEIYKAFGREVHDLVWALTDQASAGNRAERKTWERERVSRTSPQAQTIKLADLISNTKDILQNDRAFAVTYLKEKRLLLDVLDKGDRRLWLTAMVYCQNGMNELGISE